MIFGVSAGVLALLVVVVLVGATMQGLVGLGLNLVSAPVVTMVAPSLMPEVLLVLAVLLPFFTLMRSHEDIDWRGLGWVLSFRLPGTVLGVLFLALFSDRAVAIAVAVMVLVAVLLSLAPLQVPVHRGTLAWPGHSRAWPARRRRSGDRPSRCSTSTARRSRSARRSPWSSRSAPR